MDEVQREVSILQCATVEVTLRCFLSPFAEHFNARGYQVDAAAFGFTEGHHCCPPFSQTFHIPWSRSPLRISNIPAMAELRRVVSEGQYDIIHVHTPVAAFLTRLALRREQRAGKVKIIYTAHGFHFHSQGSAIRNLSYGLLEKFAGQWTDYLVVINHDDEQAARRLRLVPADRIRYMPGIGVDTQLYSPEAADHTKVAQLRAELGVQRDCPIILMIAEFIPRKCHRDALEAFASLDSKESHLLLAGDGAGRDAMEVLANDLGIAERTHFIGLRNDVRELILASTVTILPSEQEGLPRSIMESLCMQVPVIGTDIRGIRDLLDSRPESACDAPAIGSFQVADCGLLVRVGDVKALTAAMNWVLKHPNESRDLGTAGRTKMQSYDLNQILKCHENLYVEALKDRARENASMTDLPPAHGAGEHDGWYRQWGKRLIDVFVSAVSLAISLPLIAVIAVAVWLTMGAPVFFRQRRPGHHAKIFTMLKFRTMSNERDSAGGLKPDALRLTKLGKFLRSTSLDELPQLWNVLIGEMSLIGPRPLLTEYLPLYSKRQQKRHDVLPGITGLAQVRGRNATSYRRRFGLDTYYAQHVSLKLDFYILIATIRTVFGGDGGIEPIEKLDLLVEEAIRRGSF